ncbi:MAG TPA: ImmA/IrrE family metallo-endopeptidase [Chloroflexia bacterium]|nr:ImmA/IrrE family metallo-endopeptidase [Chloroflexia bacterium]
MSTLTDDIMDTLEFLIHRHRLHTNLPVDLGPILDRFDIRRHNFTPMTMGFALVRPTQMYIGINKNMDATWQRMALAHEAAHIIANQPHRLFVCKSSDWSRQGDEREAQIIASCLLVPIKVIENSYHVGAAPQIAKALKVPPSLVDLRWSFARVHGDI